MFIFNLQYLFLSKPYYAHIKHTVMRLSIYAVKSKNFSNFLFLPCLFQPQLWLLLHHHRINQTHTFSRSLHHPFHLHYQPHLHRFKPLRWEMQRRRILSHQLFLFGMSWVYWVAMPVFHVTLPHHHLITHCYLSSGLKNHHQIQYTGMYYVMYYSIYIYI